MVLGHLLDFLSGGVCLSPLLLFLCIILGKLFGGGIDGLYYFCLIIGLMIGEMNVRRRG